MAEAQSLAATLPNLPDQEATFLELNRQRQEASALDRAAARWGSADVQQGGAQAVDQAVAREGQERRMATQLQRRQFSERPRIGKAGGKPSISDMAGLAKTAGPTGAIGGMLAGAATKGIGAGGTKKALEELAKEMLGGLIKASWGNLFLTFGHSIYVIDILFLASATSSYLRKFIPGIGEEWIPPEILKRIPQAALLPLKMGEICGMAFVTFFVFMMDFIILGIIALMVAAIAAVIK